MNETLRDVPLDRFFHPRVVAMIGASATKGSSTRLLWATVRKKVEAEGGVVHPVNPKYEATARGSYANLALISHSGHQGRHLWQGQDVGIPMSHWAPTGNEVDLEFADFVKYFADQPEVGCISGYVEGFKSGPRVMLAADHALRRGVPIVLAKVGRSPLGESTAMSRSTPLSTAAGTDTSRRPSTTRYPARTATPSDGVGLRPLSSAGGMSPVGIGSTHVSMSELIDLVLTAERALRQEPAGSSSP